MNVAIFASAFYPSLGGVEELCRQLALALVAERNRVIVITERWPRDLPAREVIDGIVVYRFPMRVPTHGIKAKVNYFLTHRSISAGIRRLLIREQIQLIHVQCVSSTTWYALEMQKLLGLPLLVTLQGELSMDASGIFQRPGIAQTIMQTALESANFITACSRHSLDEAEAFLGREFGCPSKVIPNGIRIKDFENVHPYAHARPYVFAIGRHVFQKGFDVLIRAFARLEDLGYDLLIAGDGPERERLERLVNELKCEARVHFLGRADRHMVVRLFQGCAFFVLPSRHEPQGIVNLEAMACGKAVIASDVGGVGEIVEDKITGLLVESENEITLSEVIRRLVESGGLRDRLGKAGCLRSYVYDWGILSSEYRSVYALLLSN